MRIPLVAGRRRRPGITDVDSHPSTTGQRGHLTPRDRTLPRLPVDKRTLGRVYTGPGGHQHRPSMLITLTLGGPGAVHTAPGAGAACGISLQIEPGHSSPALIRSAYGHLIGAIGRQAAEATASLVPRQRRASTG
jgi:hypothetical protein